LKSGTAIPNVKEVHFALSRELTKAYMKQVEEHEAREWKKYHEELEGQPAAPSYSS